MNASHETEESVSESVSEPTTEPITEPPTESPTKTPTEPPTEAPTEPPTEPPTEAPTEPEIEFTIKTRDTVPEGTSIEFNVAVNQRCWPKISMPNNIFFMDAQIINSTNSQHLDYNSHIFQNCSRFQEFIKDVLGSEYNDRDEISCYKNEFFNNNVLIVLLIQRNAAPLEHKINAVTKSGSEICISISANEMNLTGGYMGCIQNHIILIEVDKKMVRDVDTISHYVTLW